MWDIVYGLQINLIKKKTPGEDEVDRGYHWQGKLFVLYATFD